MSQLLFAPNRVIAFEVYSMNFRTRFLIRFGISALFSVVVLAAAMNRLPAQHAGKGQERLLYDEKAYKEKLGDIKSMLAGDSAADKKTLDLAAQYYAYRLTWTELQGKHKEMPRLDGEIKVELDNNRREDRKNSEAVKLFNQALLARLKEVLPNPRPIASVNAAMVLAYMAGQGQEEVTDALADALSDKDMNPATKLWAARGLHDFYMLAFAPEDEQKVRFANKEREARTIKALLTALDMKPPQNPPASAEDIEGIRYFRGKVIEALGRSRYPAVLDAAGAGQGKTALALARILRNDGYDPTPRLAEQVAAAIGLCLLKVSPDPGYKPSNEYQLDVAAHHLGTFLVELARRHQTHKGDEQRNPATKQPWKVIGARLGVALGSLGEQANLLRRNDPTKYKSAYEFANEVVRLGLPLVKGIEADNVAPADQLDKLLQGSQRESLPIYKGDPSSVVKPGASTLTAEPEKEKAPVDDKKKEKAPVDDKK
jgi:hypothetical protein